MPTEKTSSNARVRANLASAATGLFLMALAVPHGAAAAECQNQDTGITLSPGFCATIFADNLGHVRHLAAAPDGTRSTPTPGAAVTSPTRRRRRAVFSSP